MWEVLRKSRYIVLVRWTDETLVREFIESPPPFSSTVVPVGDVDSALKRVEEAKPHIVAVPEGFESGASELCERIKKEFPAIGTALMREEQEMLPRYCEWFEEYLPPWDLQDTTTRLTTCLAIKGYNDSAGQVVERIRQALSKVALSGVGFQGGRLLTPARFAPRLLGELEHFREVLVGMPGIVDVSLVPLGDSQDSLVSEALLLRMPVKEERDGRVVCCVPVGMNFRSWYPGGGLVAVLEEEGEEVVEILKSVAELVDKELSSRYALNFSILQREVENWERERASARKNAQLNRLNQRLKELIKLRTEFVSSISHEMRTPLTSIIGYLGMVSEGKGREFPQEAKDWVAKALESAGELADFIDELLTFPAEKIATQEPSVERFKVDELITHLEKGLEPAVRKKGLEFELQYPTEAVQLRSDRSRLERVLWQLLDNAIKFTAEGRIWMNFEKGSSAELLGRISGEPALPPPESLWLYDGEVVWFEVGDTGIGIRPDDLPGIFDSFQQVDGSPSKAYRGAGVGLAIVRHLLPGLGGGIWVESMLGRGSLFKVILPADYEEYQSFRTGLWGQVHGNEPDVGQDVSNLVLAVSSDPGMLLRVRRALAKAGLRVASASAFAEGIQRLRSLQPASLILDENYAGELWEAATSVGGDLLFSGAPVVVLSPFTDTESQAYDLGAKSFVLKPFKDEELLSALESVSSRQSRVVLVSQDESLAGMLRDLLGGAGYDLMVVRTPESALLKARSSNVEGVIFAPFGNPSAAGNAVRMFHPLSQQLRLRLIFLRGENYTEYDVAQVKALGGEVVSFSKGEPDEGLSKLVNVLKPVE